MSGSFDALGHFTGLALLPRVASLVVTLNLDSVRGMGRITGSVSDDGMMADFLADRSGFSAESNPAPQAGQYTVELRSPTGGSFRSGLLLVRPNGAVRFTGRLRDGTPTSFGGSLSNQGRWPLFLASPRGKIGGFSGGFSFPKSELQKNHSP